MSELDPLRPPKSRKFLLTLVVAVSTFIGMTVSSSWWLDAEAWKVIAAAGVSAAIGMAIANAFLKGRK